MANFANRHRSASSQWLAQLRSTLLTLALAPTLLLSNSKAAFAQSASPSYFPPETIAEAFDLAAGGPPPGDVTVVESPEGGGTSFATIIQNQNGNGWTIILYPRSFWSMLDPGALAPEMRGGLLCGTLLHELQHKCAEQYGSGSGENPEDPNSCEHIAITSGTLSKLCSEMSTLFSEYRLTGEPDSTPGKLKGFCAYHRHKQDEYNNEGSAAKAAQCKCGGGYTPSPDCPGTAYPESASGCPNPYSDNQLIPPCIPCAYF